jgi:hypothetical protein
VVDSAIDSAPSLFVYICRITVVTRFGQRTDLTFKMPRMAERVKAIIATIFPQIMFHKYQFISLITLHQQNRLRRIGPES